MSTEMSVNLTERYYLLTTAETYYTCAHYKPVSLIIQYPYTYT